MRDRHAPGASAAVMLAVIGSLLALALLIWVWGGVAGTLFGHGWPAIRSGQLPSIITRLPPRLSDPSRAWPVTVRGDLPGPWGFYAALTLVASGVGVPGFFLARNRSLRRPAPGASWARRGELRSLRGRVRSRGSS